MPNLCLPHSPTSLKMFRVLHHLYLFFYSFNVTAVVGDLCRLLILVLKIISAELGDLFNPKECDAV